LSEEVVNKGRLAVVYVRDDGDVADVHAMVLRPPIRGAAFLKVQKYVHFCSHDRVGQRTNC
jgi:hypothetical protein